MSLTTMVGLVIEEMVKRGGEDLFDILRVDDGAEADRFGEIPVAQGSDVMADAFIFGAARRAQLCEVIVQDSIKAGGVFSFAGEAPHPDAIADQKVVEGTLQRFKEDAAIGAIVGIRDLSGRRIEALVAPGAVAGEHPVTV